MCVLQLAVQHRHINLSEGQGPCWHKGGHLGALTCGPGIRSKRGNVVKVVSTRIARSKHSINVR